MTERAAYHFHPEESRGFKEHIYQLLQIPETTDGKDGVARVVKDYIRLYAMGDHRLDQYVKGLGLLIEEADLQAPEVISDAVSIASKLQLWELEPAVRKVQQTDTFQQGTILDNSLKYHVRNFLAHKRAHDLKEDPTLLTPSAFHDVIASLDLTDFQRGIQE